MVANWFKSFVSRIYLRRPFSLMWPPYTYKIRLIQRHKALERHKDNLSFVTNSLGHRIAYFHYKPTYSKTEPGYTAMFAPTVHSHFIDYGNPGFFRYAAGEMGCEHGIVYIYDGFQISTDGKSPTNETRLMDDTVTMYNHIINQLNINPEKLILFGHFHGCFLMLKLACYIKQKYNKNVAAIVLHSPKKSQLTHSIDFAKYKKGRKWASLFGEKYDESWFWQNVIKQIDIVDTKSMLIENIQTNTMFDSNIPIFIFYDKKCISNMMFKSKADCKLLGNFTRHEQQIYDILKNQNRQNVIKIVEADSEGYFYPYASVTDSLLPFLKQNVF